MPRRKAPTARGRSKTKSSRSRVRSPRFGSLVRKLRTERGLGLRELAEIVGMSPAYLSMVERNELAPPAEDKVVAIAESLDQDVDEMLAIAGRIASDLPEIITRNPKVMAALVRSTRGLSANKIDALMKQATKLKARR